MNSNNRKLNHNIIIILLLVIAITIPLEKKILNVVLILFSLSALILGKYSVFKKKNSWLKLLTTLLWFIPLAQLLFLNSLFLHSYKLETKLSLFIIPLFILITIEFKKELIFRILKAFIVGGLVSSLICLLNSFYVFIMSGDISAFFYQNFSVFHHPSYFSMYLNFIIGILYFNALKPINNFKINFKWSFILILFQTLIIVLLSSKNGWITNIIIHLFFSFFILKNKLYDLKYASFIVIVILCFSSIKIIPSLKSRSNEFTKNYKNVTSSPTTTSSTNARIIAWRSASELIKNKLITGYGTGLSIEKLNEVYHKRGYDNLKEKNLNTHNQYLQYLLDHGLIGFLFLFFFTIIMFLVSLKSKDYIYAIFLFIIIINFMTESIIETQSGIVFYAFFNTIFFFHYLDKKYAIS